MLYEFYNINTCFDTLKVKNWFLLLKSLTRKTNKLRNIYTIGRGARNIFIKKWEINYFKNLNHPFYSSLQTKLCHLSGTSPSPKKGHQYQSNLLYLTELQWDISDLHLFEISIIVKQVI